MRCECLLNCCLAIAQKRMCSPPSQPEIAKRKTTNNTLLSTWSMLHCCLVNLSKYALGRYPPREKSYLLDFWKNFQASQTVYLIDEWRFKHIGLATEFFIVYSFGFGCVFFPLSCRSSGDLRWCYTRLNETLERAIRPHLRERLN